MLLPLLFTLAAAPPLPKECEQPPVRDVAPLKELANLDGAFSASLDAVATWCFDSEGAWNAGVLGKLKKPMPADAPAQGDCLKAITSCEDTWQTVKNKAPLRELAATALLDFDRVYRGARYVPKRSGLSEVPSEAADCRLKSRSGLFSMAQQRMDVARLNSQIQNEYANYKTWLFARGLECRNDVAAKAKDPTHSGLAIDQGAKVEPIPTPADPEMAAAIKLPMLEKWKYLSTLESKAETDRDFTLGFIASRELRTCDCTPFNPTAILRSIEKKEGGDRGLALLTADDPAHTRCAVCMFTVFPIWQARAKKQCAELDAISDAELLKLEKSEDAAGLPPRCLEDSKAKRVEAARLAAEAKVAAEVKAAIDAQAKLVAAAGSKTDAGLSRGAPADFGTDAGARLVAVGPDGGTRLAIVSLAGPPSDDGGRLAVVSVAGLGLDGGAKTMTFTQDDAGMQSMNAVLAAAADAGMLVAGADPANFQTINGYTYYRPQKANPPVANPPALTGGSTVATGPLTGPGVPTGPGQEEFQAPTAWAPIPTREEGRIYIRLFMSRQCTAEIEPGPLQARTGDLLLLPFDAKALMVKSPCGGLAEVYFGREARPRVSENFSKTRPLKFEFRKQ